MDGQGTKWRTKVAENFNRLRRLHERYRQTARQTDRRQTDGRSTLKLTPTAYSEREHETTTPIPARRGGGGRWRRYRVRTPQRRPMALAVGQYSPTLYTVTQW